MHVRCHLDYFMDVLDASQLISVSTLEIENIYLTHLMDHSCIGVSQLDVQASRNRHE